MADINLPITIMGIDFKSDAVRDLNPNSIFLFGGEESSVSNNYYNKDVNCNGSNTNHITGLNEDYTNLSSIARTWIVSKFGILNGDGIVELNSQRISEFDTIMTNRPHVTKAGFEGEQKDIYSIIRGLDEPEVKELAYEINEKSSNLGFITYQRNYISNDKDLYKIIPSKNGTLTLGLSCIHNPLVRFELLDENLNLIYGVNNTYVAEISAEVTSKPYYIRITGEATNQTYPTYEHPYTLTSQLVATPPPTLSPPTSLKATAGNGQVSLSWSAPSSGTPTSYTVYRSTSQNGIYTTLTPNPTSLSYTAAGLTNGTTYWFNVKANYTSGQSLASNSISSTPTSGITYYPPRNLAASAGNGQVSLSWSAPSSGTPSSYNVYKGNSENGSYSFYDSSPITSKNVTNLSNGSTYWFYVKAVYALDISDPSNRVSATPKTSTLPSNDECSNAITLIPNTSCSNTSGDIEGATQSYVASGCPSGLIQDVWYKFTATSNATYSIRLSPSSSMDGIAEVRQGSCAGTILSCSDNGGGNGGIENLNISATNGIVYYIRVYEYNAIGNITPPATTTFNICVIGGSINGDNCTITSLSSSSETRGSSSFSTTPGEDDIMAYGQPNCTFTVSESCSWLTVTPMSGTMNSNTTGTIGQAFLNYSIQENTSTNSRQCTFYINGIPVTINQNGAEINDDDFYIQNVNVPSTTLAINGSLTVSCDQCYSGSKSDSELGATNLGYYLSTNASFDSNDIQLATDGSGLGSDDPCNSESAILTIPGITTPGSYYILFVADYDKLYPESNETNNVMAVQISVSSAFHDIFIQNESVIPDRIMQGGITSVSSNLCYSGSEPKANIGNMYIGYYLSTNTTYESSSDIFLGNGISDLGNDKPFELEETKITIPVETSPGNYYILFVADYNNRFTEVDENNNVKYKQITVTTIPTGNDFYIHSASVTPKTITVGNTIETSCYQCYTGTTLDVNMNSSFVGYYLSTNTSLDIATDIKLGQNGSSIGSDYPCELEIITLTVPAGAIPGSYYLLFVADYDGRFAENNENNNVFYIAINIEGACIDPSIALHPAIQTKTAPESASFSVTATGSNNQYQWQYNTGSSWDNVPSSSPYSGVNTTTLNISSTLTSMNGYQYRCYVTSSCTSSTVTSNSVLLMVSEAGCTAPSAPATCSTSIGVPANGLEHMTNLYCDIVSGAEGYFFEYSYNGTTWYADWGSNYGNSLAINHHDYPNFPIYYRVRAYSCSPVKYSNYTYASPQPIYTSCDDAAAPTVNGATSNSLNVTLNAETPVANPIITTYSIYCSTTSQYVQINGTLGSSEAFQTKAAWGTKTVTGLLNNKEYCFYAKARNNDGDVRFNTANAACGTTINGSPVANFSASPLSDCTPLTVNFTDESTGSPTSWAWDIDNNGVTDYTIKNPTHTYSIAGTYSVKLTVTNASGSNSKTQPNYISALSSVSLGVSINVSPSTTISSGQQVIFTATPTNGGTTPSFQWSINGVIVGNNSPNYSTSTLLDGQIVSCRLTSNNPCANPLTAVSNSITMKVGFPVNSEVIYMSDLIKVYPNPTSGEITIEGLPENQKSKVAVFDLNGKSILSKITGETTEKIDLTNFVPGTYLLIVNEHSIKIIKK